MNLAEHLGDPGAPCLACGCPYSWITGNVQVMQLCCRCYPRRGTPADVWAELKENYSKRQVVAIQTSNKGYEALFDERNLHKGRSKRQPSSDDCYDGNLWEVQS
jgi:hypothetical protein